MVRGRNTRVIGVRISDELHQRIQDDADNLFRTLSPSDWLREAIDEKLAASEEIHPQMKTSIKQKSKSQTAKNNTQPASAQANPRPAETSDEVSPGNRFPGTPRSVDCPCGSGEKYKRCCGEQAPSAGKKRKK